MGIHSEDEIQESSHAEPTNPVLTECTGDIAASSRYVGLSEFPHPRQNYGADKIVRSSDQMQQRGKSC